MVKYLGVLLLLVGAVLLIVVGFTNPETNIMLGSGLALVVVGYLVHIFLNKKVTE